MLTEGSDGRLTMAEKCCANRAISGPHLDSSIAAVLLGTSHRANPHLTRPALKSLADRTFVAQSEEIGGMSSVLETK